MVAAGCVVLTSCVAPGSARSEDRIAAPAREVRCALDGWTNNGFGGDIPVRDAPAAPALIIGHLPITRDGALIAYGDRRYSVRFAVIGFANGWLKIDQASDSYNDETGIAKRDVYAGKGWVPANAVRFQIQSARGFTAPDASSRRVVDLGSDWATDLGEIENVRACNGSWALVDLLVMRKRSGESLVEVAESERFRHRAWFRGVCGNEETTCDAVSVDIGP